jgi:glycerol-3-phosphate dehydrogenase
MKKLGHGGVSVTGDAPLPGGEFTIGFDAFLASVNQRWPFLGSERAYRMARAYGAMLDDMLAGATSADDLGTDFGGGLTAREVDWLVEHEWARTADDILHRRTKIGLATGAETVTKLQAFLVVRKP